MSATIGTLFGNTAAATAKWKPVTTAAPAEGSWKAVSTSAAQSTAGDSVEVSGLAKSLTGVAGKVFASLGSKGRAMLEGFVKSGQMTEEEVALGLRSLATEAVRGRYMRERTLDDEDKEWKAKGEIVEKAFQRKMDRMDGAYKAMDRHLRVAYSDLEKDQDTEAFQARMAPASQEYREEREAIDKEERDAIGGDPGTVHAAVLNHFLKKGMTGFANIEFSEEYANEESGLLPSNHEKGKAAADKMLELGFFPKVFRNGLAYFAADVDIPGIGRGTVKNLLPESDPSAAEEAAASGKPAPQPPPTVLTTQASTGGARSFAAVTDDARSALDAGYEAMTKAGKAMNFATATQQDIDTLFAGFDRRSLYAIASNSGGKFSKDEQDTAQSIMSRQQGEAMRAADPTGTDHAAAYRAGISFLDKVSEEEKTSANWSVQRAAAQFGYESSMRQKGAEPDRLDSDSALVRMLKGALDGQKDKEPGAIASGGYVKDLMDMPLFRDGVPGLAEYLNNAVSVKV